jgi:HEAT repeat protein
MLVKIARNTPEAIQYLIQIIEDTNSLGSVVVDAAILGLGQLGSSAKDAIPALKHIASYHYAMVALAQIGDMKPSEVAKQLISLIPPTGIFDDRLIIGLGILGPDVADIVVPPLIELLNNESIRVLVIRALGKMGPKAQNAIPKLIQLVKSGIGWSYGLDAIRTLGDIGPYAKVAVPTIIWAMQTNKNEKYLKICGEALAKITGKDFGIDTNRWNTWWRTGK